MINFEKKNKKKQIQYTIRFDEELLEKIREIANKENLSVNEIVNQSMRYVLNEKLEGK